MRIPLSDYLNLNKENEKEMEKLKKTLLSRNRIEWFSIGIACGFLFCWFIVL